jgi:hypothetical protein
MNFCKSFGNLEIILSHAEGCGGNDDTPNPPAGSGEIFAPLSRPFASVLQTENQSKNEFHLIIGKLIYLGVNKISLRFVLINP